VRRWEQRSFCRHRIHACAKVLRCPVSALQTRASETNLVRVPIGYSLWHFLVVVGSDLLCASSRVRSLRSVVTIKLRRRKSR